MIHSTKPVTAAARRGFSLFSSPWRWRSLMPKPWFLPAGAPAPVSEDAFASGLCPWSATGADIFSAALAAFGLQGEVPAAAVSRIPAAGPLVVVVNQPFDLAACVVLGALLQPVRPDFKVWNGHQLGYWPALNRYWLGETGGSADVGRRNQLRLMKQALAWVRAGGVLVVALPGEERQLPLRPVAPAVRRIDQLLTRLIRRTETAVLPVHIPGRGHWKRPAVEAWTSPGGENTSFLGGERIPQYRVPVRVGALLSPPRLAALATGPALIRHLRLRTYMLQGCQGPAASAPVCARFQLFRRPAGQPFTPVVTPVSGAAGQGELDALPPDQCLSVGGETEVWYATAGQIPRLLREIGRLRELTFRLAGEGTGNSLDLDRHDAHYLHLLAWNRERQEVIGAYRMGQTDIILPQFGINGLYANSLFHFRRGVVEALGPALELGRSFVRPEYQRNFTSLLCLWKGIGKFVARHPRYRCLFGPVSISDHYLPVSRHLLAAFLRSRHGLPAMARAVRPRHPFGALAWGGVSIRQGADDFLDLDEVSRVVADLEDDGKGVPVLVRQYLKLGGRMIDFNLDQKFSNVLDGLVLVDLMRTEPPLLEKYLGREGAAIFRQYQQSQGHETAATAVPKNGRIIRTIIKR
jgi:hypothetical protein